jgi:hypothetical protein
MPVWSGSKVVIGYAVFARQVFLIKFYIIFIIQEKDVQCVEKKQ